jgi:UDP-glucose 4-epimerase
MRVLVTGGAGFIGSHVALGLLRGGHEVAVLDDLSSGRRDQVPAGASFYELDIRAPGVRKVFEDFGPEVLCHHAAQMDVRRSVADPVFDAEVNVVGSLRLFELCREAGTRRIVFASTGGAMYGEQAEFPAPESHPAQPVSPYGVAKLAVEHYLHYYAVEYGLQTTSLRYANVYGPRQNPHGEAGVVAIFCDRLLRGQVPCIFGDGEQTRDFVFVDDVVRANLLALDRELTGVFNVGTGVETTVTRLCRTLCDELAPATAPRFAPARPGEQARSSIAPRRLAQEAGWRPQVSLEEGLARTAAYFREQALTVA